MKEVTPVREIEGAPGSRLAVVLIMAVALYLPP